MTHLLLAALWIATPVAAEITAGHIYALDKAGSKPIFEQKTVVTIAPDGLESQTSKIVDASGKTVMTEQTLYNGVKLISQKIEQLQTGEAWELEVKGQDLIVRTFSLKDGVRKLEDTDSEKVSGSLVSGPVARNFLKENWEQLLNGKTVEARFVVMELGGTVGFDFTKKSATDKEVVIVMRPSSFFVDLMVDPIEMTFDAVEKRMIRYRGRTPLKTLVGKKWKPVDSEIQYQQEKPGG